MAKTPFNLLRLEELASVDVVSCKYSQEPIVISGVVSQFGQSGRTGRSDYEVHYFSFAAWRRGNGPVLREELTVLRPTAPGTIFEEHYEAGTVHKLIVLLSADETRAVVAGRVKTNFLDGELKDVREELRDPVFYRTKRYGILKLNKMLKWFEGQANWIGSRVQLNLESEDKLDITAQLITADALFDQQSQWNSLINSEILKELLDQANQGRPQRSKRISTKEFLGRIELRVISVRTEGEFQFWYNNGGMFEGTAIMVSGSIASGVTDVQIPG